MTEIVPATAEMFRQIDGKPPARSARAFAVVDGDKVMWIAGFYPDTERMVLFAGVNPEVRPELKRHRRELIRCARRVMGMVAEKGMPVHSYADPSIEGSEVLLHHFGFTHKKDGVYVWHGCR